MRYNTEGKGEKTGSKQQATSCRQASREGRKGEGTKGRKEMGSKQQATSCRQACREGAKGGRDERAKGNRQQATGNKQQAGKP
ncbi:MAG: hypothetical protein LBL13_01995 [Bacteroidales bacterium]|nr:hypothetical protein [Bacteroidales bacterium]